MVAGNERSRPRIGVLGYGSILDPEDIDDVIDGGGEDAIPVRVEGFKRLFNQEASWREVEGTKRGVLNVVRDDDSWFNAVLLADLTRDEFKEYRKRERGYVLVEVERQDVVPYNADDRPRIEDLDVLLVPTGKKVDDDIEPIPEYIEICLRGAEHWDEEHGGFYHDFLETTETASGMSLEQYLQRR